MWSGRAGRPNSQHGDLRFAWRRRAIPPALLFKTLFWCVFSDLVVVICCAIFKPPGMNDPAVRPPSLPARVRPSGFILPVLPFDTLHVIAGGGTTRLQEARGLRTPVRETCAATGMEAPATSAGYRGIACPRAIFVPTTPRLLIAFPASRIRSGLPTLVKCRAECRVVDKAHVGVQSYRVV